MRHLKSLLLFLLLLVLATPGFAQEGTLAIELENPRNTVEAGESFTLQFYIKNTCSEKLTDISSSLIIPEDSSVEFEEGAQSSYSYDLEANEEIQLVFLLRASSENFGPSSISLHTSSTKAGDEECPTGDSLNQVNSYLIEVEEKEEDWYDDSYYYDSGYSESDSKNKPKLIISKYKIEPSMPRAGESFTMTLSFLNTNSEKSCRNIKIYLTSDGPSDPDSAGLAQGGIFSPVASSNTFYIDYIEPGETKEKTITFSTLPTAASKTYTMSANFEYEDYQGTELKATELIGIPVVQVSKVQVDEPEISSMGPGAPAMVDVSFYNTGRDNLTNFMVSIEGEGFSADQKRYFVGNFQTGSYDSFSTTLYIDGEGEYEGKILITYEDSTGTSHSIEKAFTGYQEMMGPMDFEDFPMEEMGSSPLKNFKLLGGLALALIILVIVLIKRRRSSKRRQELDLNELD